MSKINILEITLKAEENWEEQKQAIIDLYPKVIKHYVFQLEKGDSGYLHFQGRISLVKKRTAIEAGKNIKTYKGLSNIYCTPTCNNEIKFNAMEAFYCIKDDTRVEGPWKDSDEVIYIPRQVREITSLFPWQTDVINTVGKWDTRSINVIVDKTGCTGKSTLVQYMRAYKLARKIPFSNDYKDILRMVCDMPSSQAYIFDMPRAINKEKLYQFYSAIEEIKGGYAFDDRYTFKEKIFDCPTVWVFSNEYPDKKLLSIDRWKCFQITEGMELRRTG